MPAPIGIEGWKKVFDAQEQRILKLAEAVVKQSQVSVTSKELDGLPVLESDLTIHC